MDCDSLLDFTVIFIGNHFWSPIRASHTYGTLKLYNANIGSHVMVLLLVTTCCLSRFVFLDTWTQKNLERVLMKVSYRPV